MKISEGDLIRLVKYHIVSVYKEKGIEAMCINECLPLCAALLFPYRAADINEINDDRIGTVMPLIVELRKLKKQSKELESYSFESLRHYFQLRWIGGLKFIQQKNLLKGITLIADIQDDGYFSLKGNDKVYNLILDSNIINIEGNYGEKERLDYILESMKENTDSPRIANYAEEVSLTNLREFMLKEFPPNKYANGLKTKKFMWEYRLSQSQYKKLKAILLSLNLGDNTRLLKSNIIEYGDDNCTLALVVVLYISEWYKRECYHLDGDRCLESIGLSSSNSAQIWRYSGLSRYLLHQGDGNQLRQLAMCVLGGFPLRYVNSSHRFERLVNNLINLGNEDSQDLSEDIVDDLAYCFDDNNSVFKASLQQGSCRKFLLQLARYLEYDETDELPFNETDLELEPFSEFIILLENGYEKNIRNDFIKPEIRIWTYDGTDSVESEFCVQIGPLSHNNLITTKELKLLGFTYPEGTTSFNFKLRTKDRKGNIKDHGEFRRFNLIGNGYNDFCGVYGSSLRIDFDLFSVKEIYLVFFGDGIEEKVKQIYDVPSCLELYATDNYYLWTTKTNNSKDRAILFDCGVYSLNHSDVEDTIRKSGPNCEWLWIDLKEDITLHNVITGEDKDVFVGAGNSIQINYKNKELKKNINMNGGCVQCIVCEEKIEVPLLSYNQRVDGVKNLLLSCDNKSGIELENNYIIEYKRFNEQRFREWDNPAQGLLILRITCRNSIERKRPIVDTVYFIPDVYPVVRRDQDNNTIYFKGKPIFLMDDNNEERKQRLNHNKNRYQDSPEDMPDSNSITFLMGNSEEHIVLEVYRAFHQTQIFNKNRLIKTISAARQSPPIAEILASNIKLRIVDENGPNSTVFEKIYVQHFENPDQLCGKTWQDPQGYTRYIYLGQYNDGGRLRQIKLNDDKTELILNVSDKFASEYEFYFWSGKIKEVPLQLDKERIGDRTYKFHIPVVLRDNAVVFQSLKAHSPNLYFRPFYGNDLWIHQSGLFRRFDELLNSFQIAVSHNTYFCIFPAFNALRRIDYFSEFILDFIKYRDFVISSKDGKNINRLAFELGMDCFFVDRHILFEHHTDEEKDKIKSAMRTILQQSPLIKGGRIYARNFADRFLRDANRFNVRDGKNIARKFIKAIDSVYDNHSFIHIENERIEFLNELKNNQDDLFVNVCNVLNINN